MELWTWLRNMVGLPPYIGGGVAFKEPSLDPVGDAQNEVDFTEERLEKARKDFEAHPTNLDKKVRLEDALIERQDAEDNLNRAREADRREKDRLERQRVEQEQAAAAAAAAKQAGMDKGRINDGGGSAGDYGPMAGGDGGGDGSAGGPDVSGQA